MRDIKELGFTPIVIRQLLNYHLGINLLPDKPIMVTFDDAYDSFYTDAAPIMVDLDISSVCFVPTKYVGASTTWDAAGPTNHMDWDQIQNLNRTNMVDFQSHSDSHPTMRTLEDRDILVELIYSKTILEDKLAKPIECIAWPHGSFDERCIHHAKAAGYTAAFAVKNMIQKLNDIQPFAIRRVYIEGTENGIKLMNAHLNKINILNV